MGVVEADIQNTVSSLYGTAAVFLTVAFILGLSATFAEKLGKLYGMAGTVFAAAGFLLILAGIWYPV